MTLQCKHHKPACMTEWIYCFFKWTPHSYYFISLKTLQQMWVSDNVQIVSKVSTFPVVVIILLPEHSWTWRSLELRQFPLLSVTSHSYVRDLVLLRYLFLRMDHKVQSSFSPCHHHVGQTIFFFIRSSESFFFFAKRFKTVVSDMKGCMLSYLVWRESVYSY